MKRRLLLTASALVTALAGNATQLVWSDQLRDQLRVTADSLQAETERRSATGRLLAPRATEVRRFRVRLDSLADAIPDIPPDSGAPSDSITGDTTPPPDSTPPDSVPPGDSTPPDTVAPPLPIDTARFVGPAEKPRVLLAFTYPRVTGRRIDVRAGGDLQAALHAAQRGDEIVLEAGARFVGNFVLPPKIGSAAQGWVLVRSSATLPPIGTRVGPADSAAFATLITPNTSPALATAAGTSGWWLSGLEATTSPAIAPTTTVYRVVALGAAGAAQTSLAQVPADLVLDRMWIHPRPAQYVQRCVELNSARTQITDSYLFDCHTKGQDSQAIIGWNGPGPFKIVNNMLAGAGENVMFGGGTPSIPGLVPSDIEFRRNHVHTPRSWRGGVWTKKNLLELKNAQRWWIEGNVFDGSWKDGQDGYAVVLKVSSNTTSGGGCTWCTGSDIIIRRNLVRCVGMGIGITGKGDLAMTLDSTLRRVAVLENYVDSIHTAACPGEGGRTLVIQNGVRDLLVKGNTFASSVPTNSLVTTTSTPAGVNVQVHSNVWSTPLYGIVGCGTACLVNPDWRGNLYVRDRDFSGLPAGWSRLTSLDAAIGQGAGVSRWTIEAFVRGVERVP